MQSNIAHYNNVDSTPVQETADQQIYTSAFNAVTLIP